MGELRVLILSDGRPGHFNLSEGIVAALARRVAVAVSRQDVSRLRLLPGAASAALLAAGVAPAIVLRAVYGLEAEALPAADVVVSAGGDTLAANVAVARLQGAANVFYGSLRAFRPAWFTLALTSYAEDARAPHPVAWPKPSARDPDALPQRPFVPGQPPQCAGLLVGGDSGEARYTAAEWDRLIALLSGTHAAWGTRWIVSNSRRTPGPVSDRLAAAAARGGPIAELIDVRNAGSPTLDVLLGAAEAVLVTADSSSMLSEAVWLRRPTIALRPAHFRLSAREAGYRRRLQADGAFQELALGEATPERSLAALAAVRPQPGHPLDALADLLQQRLAGRAPVPSRRESP